MIRRLTILALLLFVTGCLFAAPAAQAKEIFGGVCAKAGTDTSAVCTDSAATDPNQDPFSGSDGVLAKVTNIVAFVGGATAVIMIVYSAIRYVTSGSDLSTNSRTDTDVESAKHTITNALIGIVVIVAGRAVILFVLSKQ